MSRKRAIAIGLAIGIGVGLRLTLAVAFVGNYDELSFELVASILRRGGNIYAETERYNYTPAWALILHGLDALALPLAIPFHAVVRGFLTLVDVANAVIIGRIGRTYAGAPASAGFIAYLLNPVAILIVGLHGQFETLAALPILVAILLSGRTNRVPGAMTWALGTLAVVIKHILAFQLWMLFWHAFEPRRRFLLVAASGAVFVATFLPYLPQGAEGILQNVFLYGGVRGVYGFGSLLPYLVAVVLFVSVMLALPYWSMRRGLDVARATQLSAVVLLATIFGIGEQYFLIPILFASAFRGAWYWSYSAAATLFLATSRNNLNAFSVPPLWNLVWIFALGWAISLAFAGIRRRALLSTTEDRAGT